MEAGAEAVSVLPLVARWNIQTDLSWFVCLEKTIMGAKKEGGKKIDMVVISENLELTEWLDFAALKEQGYRVRFTINYKVKSHPTFLLGQIGERHYQVEISSGSHNLFGEDFTVDCADQKNYLSCRRLTNEFLLSDVTGSLNVRFSTANVYGIDLCDIMLTIEFLPNDLGI